MNKNHLFYLLRISFGILLTTFVLDKIIYFSLNKISDHVFTGQSIGKVNQYLQVMNNQDLIIFGSSRANHNINPAIITPKGFNMGTDGRALAFSAALIKLLPKNKKQVLLLHIDPQKAFLSSYDGEDISPLLTKYNRIKEIRIEVDRLHQNNPFQKFYWSLSYNNKVVGILKNFFKPGYNVKTYTGYDPIFPTEEQKSIFKRKLEKSKPSTCDSLFTMNNLYNSYLNELITFCASHNKKLILFTSPLYQDDCKADNEKLAELIKRKNILYYDFSDFFRLHNKLDYWKDEDHLSAVGAQIFTDSVKSIITPYLNETIF